MPMGKNCEFGKGVILGENVEIGDNNKFGNYIVITDNVKIGSNNYFSDFVSIGRPTQHRKEKFEFKESQSGKIVIGNNNVFREYINVHKPMKEITRIGNSCYIMAFNHISHDTIISDNVVLANNCQIGGYTFIGKTTFLGLSCALHQETTIGAFCHIGMQSNITKDIPPGIVAYGNPIVPKKVDTLGLSKIGFKDKEIEEVISFYQDNKTRVMAKKNLSNISSKIFSQNFLEFINISRKEIILPDKSWNA